MTPDSSKFLLRNCLGVVQFLPQVIVISMLLIIQCMLPWHVEKRRGAKVSRNRHDWYVLKEKILQSKYETDSSEDMATQKYTFKHEGGRGSKRLWEGGKDSEREQKKGLLLKMGGTCKLCVNASVSATVQLFLQRNATIAALYESIYCVNLS